MQKKITGIMLMSTLAGIVLVGSITKAATSSSLSTSSSTGRVATGTALTGGINSTTGSTHTGVNQSGNTLAVTGSNKTGVVIVNTGTKPTIVTGSTGNTIPTNWVGIYKGKPTCDTCDYTESTLQLRADNTFIKIFIYKKDKTSKSLLIIEKGNFVWGSGITANVITLDNKQRESFTIMSDKIVDTKKSENVFWKVERQIVPLLPTVNNPKPIVSPQKDNNQVIIPNATKDSLNWTGTYKGVLPCASCEGIKVTITLQADNTFTKTDEYITNKAGKNIFEEKGTFTWDKSMSIITLSNADRSKYLVSKGQITQLDASGRKILGTLASNYILKK